MTCKICGSPSEKLFTKQILGKYTSGYYRCGSCDFIQTDDAVWLTEAYSSAITALDIGLVQRNISFSEQCGVLIDRCFNKSERYVDYAGGYGLFVRLMRDKGFDFYRQDIHCENLFANHFDVTDLPQGTRFDLATAFEVFEHFEDPLPEIRKIFGYADTVIFSTQLIPDSQPELANWWYLAPETGQHIAFYSRRTLQKIASVMGRRYYHNGIDFHIITKEVIPEQKLREDLRATSWFGLKRRPAVAPRPRQSLLQSDYERIKSHLQKQQGG